MTVTATSTSTARQRWLKAALGRPADWHLTTPHISAPRPGLSWLGPILIAISALVAWPAFAGATGEDGSVQLGLFVGAVSIVLMAWSFLLAVRVRWLEPLFGGLDSMYRVHRWAGTLAVVAMWLHTSVEAEIEGGIRGASRSVANSAEDLAGTGQTMLYILVGISLIRWFPYRWWRLTHKLLGIPFAFACWHFYTAEKTYANGSPWGIYFATIMVVGLASYVLRVVGKDAIAQGLKYRIVSHTRSGSTSCVDMEPVGRPMKRRAGQFVTFKIQRPGLREPHSFTVASSPTSELLRFYIRDLGDWTAKIQTADLIGAEVLVEGPFGTFEPLPHHRAGTPVLWVAGGVGITPFLSAIDGLPIGVTDHGPKPVLFYCVRHRDDASAIDMLDAAHADGRVELHVVASSQGPRFNEAMLLDRFGPNGLAGAHVASCGPSALTAEVDRAARSLGASGVEVEAFDIRSGFGPDLSREFDELVTQLRRS